MEARRKADEELQVSMCLPASCVRRLGRIDQSSVLRVSGFGKTRKVLRTPLPRGVMSSATLLLLGMISVLVVGVQSTVHF